VNHGRSNDRIDGWWSKPPQDSGERALVGQRKDPVEEKRRASLANLLVSLDTADAFIDALSAVATHGLCVPDDVAGRERCERVQGSKGRSTRKISRRSLRRLRRCPLTFLCLGALTIFACSVSNL
jgi:hypothetical protein